MLLEKGADINTTDVTMSTLLHNAAYTGKLAVVKLLAERNDIKINLLKCLRMTSLHAVCSGEASNDSLKVILFFLLRKYIAFIFQICEILIEKGADINIEDFRGYTPLHIAASKGILSIVKFLVDRNDTNIDVRNIFGCTPLHLACEEHKGEVAVLLVEHGANIKIKNMYNKTPIDLCSSQLATLLKNKTESF